MEQSPIAIVVRVKSDQFSKMRGFDANASVSAQVADHLTRLISDGLLAPGDKLPGETVLSRRLGVSRPTLREALGVLAARQLVEVRPRSGKGVGAKLALEKDSLRRSARM